MVAKRLFPTPTVLYLKTARSPAKHLRLLIVIGGSPQKVNPQSDRFNKKQKPRLRRRFRREARSAARLNHPAIVQIYDIFEGPESDWIVMELVEGETLAHRLRRGALELEAALAVLRALHLRS